MKYPSLLTLLVLVLSPCLPCSYGIESGAELDKAVAEATLVKVGQVAPDFTCKATDGREFTLSALRGKVVVLYFFSVRVPPCLIEMKYLETEIYQKLRNKEDFRMIAVGRENSREELVTLGGEKKLTFPLVADVNKEVYERYFTKFTPRTVVVGKNGSITYIASGWNEYQSVLKLQAVLARELAVKTP